MKDKNEMMTSANEEKAFHKIQHCFMMKTLNETGIEHSSTKLKSYTYIHTLYKKPTANIISNREILKAFSLELK